MTPNTGRPMPAPLAITDYTAEHVAAGLGAAAAYGLLGIVLLLAGFKLFELVTPKLDVEKKLQDGSLAVAIVVAALLVAIAIVAAAAIQ